MPEKRTKKKHVITYKLMPFPEWIKIGVQQREITYEYGDDCHDNLYDAFRTV
jgi:hypothetical protein